MSAKKVNTLCLIFSIATRLLNKSGKLLSVALLRVAPFHGIAVS
jgi:hypothetical protein